MLFLSVIALAALAASSPPAPPADQQFDISCKVRWITGKDLPFRYTIDLTAGQYCNLAQCARPSKIDQLSGDEIVIERRAISVAAPNGGDARSLTQTRYDRKAKTISMTREILVGGKPVQVPARWGDGSCSEAPFTGFDANRR